MKQNGSATLLLLLAAAKDDPVQQQIPLWKVFVLLAAFGLLFGPEISFPNIVGPIVSPAPFQSDDLCVLIVEETDDRNNYTAGQREAISGTTASSPRKLAKDGNFIVLDKDNPPKADASPQWLQDAWAKKGDSLPWIVAASKKGGFSKLLPGEVNATLDLLKPLANL